MADSLSDFSKILELQEIKKLYEEQEERHKTELSSKEERITALQDELNQKESMMSNFEQEIKNLQDERERLREQISVIRGDLESKIEKLQNRIKELSQQPEKEAGKKGFFRS